MNVKEIAYLFCVPASVVMISSAYAMTTPTALWRSPATFSDAELW